MRTESTDEIDEDMSNQVIYFESTDVGVDAASTTTTTTTSSSLDDISYEDFDTFVDYVNNGNFSWKAQVNSRFIGLKLSEMRNPDKIVSPTRGMLS